MSAACRAFWLQGGKARYDGVDGRTGGKRVKSVSALQEHTASTMRAVGASKRMSGARVEWAISPTVTALTSFPATTTACGNSIASGLAATQTLGTDGLLDLLATDFARAVKDLAAVLADLKRLAVLGDLPLAVVGHEGAESKGMRLAVYFPGCDEESVERLCADVGVRRGVVRADPAFENARDAEMALRFPFAPGVGVAVGEGDGAGYDGDGYFHREVRPERLEWRHMMSPTEEETLTTGGLSEHGKTDDGMMDGDDGLGDGEDVQLRHPWLTSSPSGYSSMHESDYEHGGDVLVSAYDASGSGRDGGGARGGAADYDGLEGIYRFLRECDGARR